MNRGSRTIVAGLAALAVFGTAFAAGTPASAATWRGHHYVYARYYHQWHHYRHYGWGYRRDYYGPGPILGGLGLLAGAAAALTVGPYPYYHPYSYGPGPYWW
jgi:hypothetical protein